ncbi:MAG: type II toxin-antitoxin system VapC family toxin [Gammaproteobacteria bacterium]|nr:type II toxin-antitoxin system VapC family toxin [Gammaproteobacteria bacterium]
MQYMLDTDTCIYLIKRKPPGVLARFQRHKPGDAVISAITLAELEFGVEKSGAPQRNRSALDALTELIPSMDFDSAAAAAYGRVRHHLEKAGRSIGSFDTLIAAHALSLSLILVTNNERHFARVSELNVENWAKA